MDHSDVEDVMQPRRLSRRTAVGGRPRGSWAAWLALVLMLVTGVAGAADEWVREDAPWRLRVGVQSLRSQVIRVDIPVPLAATTSGVAAFLGARPVSATLRRVSAQQAFAELARVRIPSSLRSPAEGDAVALPIHIYLLNGADDAVPCAPEDRRPVVLQRTTASLTTRPFSALELQRFFCTAVKRTYSIDMGSMGGVIDRSSWQQPPEKRSAVMEWSAGWLVAEDGDYVFGTDQRHVSWAVFLDGTPVADWRRSQPLGKASCHVGRSVAVPAGLHHLVYRVVQREGEPIPVFLCARGAGKPAPLPAEQLASVRGPAAIAVESQDGDVRTGLRYDDEVAGMVRGVDTRVCTARFGAVTPEAGEPPLAVRVAGRPQPLGTLGAWVGCVVPAHEILAGDHTFGFPARYLWHDKSGVRFGLRLGRTVPVRTPTQPLSLPVSVRVEPDEALEVVSALTVAWELGGPDGALAAGRLPVPAQSPALPTAVDVRLDGSARRVVTALALRGTPMCDPVGLRLLPPSEFMSGLTAEGDCLYVGTERAMLLAHPLPETPGPRRQGSVPSADAARVAILDDFWAVTTGPEADLLPEHLLESELGSQVTRLSVRGVAGGTGLRMFPMLAQALDGRPDITVFAVGAESLRHGVSPATLCLYLLYGIQACRHRGVVPVLMALPSLPGVDASLTRRSALLVKELAFRAGVPVVDAYSHERLSGPGPAGFAATFQTRDGSVALAVPNNDGRRWLATVTARTLGDHLSNAH